jgi:hypothetical protein
MAKATGSIPVGSTYTVAHSYVGNSVHPLTQEAALEAPSTQSTSSLGVAYAPVDLIGRARG